MTGKIGSRAASASLYYLLLCNTIVHRRALISAVHSPIAMAKYTMLGVPQVTVGPLNILMHPLKLSAA